MTAPLTVACVRTGQKYGVEYVHRLKAMVARHLDRPHRFVCLTDRPSDLPLVECVPVSLELPGWWGKLALLSTQWRVGQRVIYLDLDSVICGGLAPLADLDVPFGVCANFTRAAGHLAWPCRYGSCVMTIGSGWGGHAWQRFLDNADAYMAAAGKYGDQMVIEQLAPNAALLQDHLPAGYFLGYRDLEQHRHAKPDGCSVVVFAGRRTPANCDVPWVRQAWEGQREAA